MNKCGSKEKVAKPPVGTPVNKEKDVCVMAGSSAEHARFDGTDLPCDDARGTLEQPANKLRRDVMSSCQILDRNKIPGPVMANIDTGRMDQTEVERSAIAYAKKFSSDPMLLSWFSKKEGVCGPSSACHEDGSLWLDYAVSRGADLSVIVNDWDYVFIFKKSA